LGCARPGTGSALLQRGVCAAGHHLAAHHPCPHREGRMTLVNEEPGVGERPLALRSERAPFVMLPRWLLHHPRVTEGAKVLYCVLHDLVAGREGPTCPVTRAQLSDLCGVSVDTVDRRLAQLVAARAVEKQAQVPA